MATRHLKPLNLSAGIQNSMSAERRRPLISPPIFLSTDRSNVDLSHLRALLSSTNRSGHYFPDILPDGSAAQPDPAKSAAALRHSFVVVSAFARRSCPLFGDDRTIDEESSPWWYRLEEAMPLSASNGRLVGFGRASSDGGLTAAIHDVSVLPSFQGLGIGKKIVQRIIRVLTNKGIYDISALCSKEESAFFRACGFGDDMLGSTTMMYTRSPSCAQEGAMVKRAGRLLLAIPPEIKPFAAK
ncbi:unnamed protein product [Victoria cruziana]